MKKHYTTPEIEAVDTVDVVTTSGEDDVTTGIVPFSQGATNPTSGASDANFNL